MLANKKPNEIHIVRIYDAPVDAVWEAWTDPEQTAQWWGPRGFTLTTHSKDLKPGGHWRYTMHGPDGTDYPNTTTYFEVEPHRKLVYDHGANDNQPPMFRVTVLFSCLDDGQRTKMEMWMALATADAAVATEGFIKKAGGNATWDRLAEYLEEQSTGKGQFVINRSFDAPLDVMYEMWTDPTHVARWLPPTGFTMRFLRSDIRPGGSTFYLMTNGDVTMQGRAEYRELLKPNRLVYTQQFCDEQERITRHPNALTWPETMLTTVDLTEEGPDRTRVTVTWEPFGPATPEELKAFLDQRPGMTLGWTGSFDKLDELFANA